MVSNLGNEFDLGTIEANKIHIKVDGSSLVRNPTTDVVIDLSDLKKVVTANTNGIALSGTGEASNVLKANLIVDPVAGNLLQVTVAGAKVTAAAITAISVAAATVDVQDAFGTHLY